MKRFAQLFAELDATTSTNAKVEALARYFDEAPPHDAAWAVYFLAGGKPRQVVPMGTLGALACEVAGVPDWLFGACYEQVGDLAETISLVLPLDGRTSDVGLAEWIEQRLLPLRGKPFEEVAPLIKSWWLELDAQGRFLLTKLIGGAFRVGVSKLLVQRALAQHAGVDAKRVAQRMMGYTDGKVMPSPQRYLALIAQTEEAAGEGRDVGQPYPFFLAHQLDVPPELFKSRLGPVEDWMVEWKYDGIRGQVIKRGGQVWIWTRGEELATERFPEIVAAAQSLPDGTVIDGEILVWNEDVQRPAPFSILQQRIGRKNLTKKILDEAPVSFMAYDLVEEQGQDIRSLPQRERRARLEALLAGRAIRVSPIETADSWLDFARKRERSRELGVEGFMLKRLDAAYGTGRTKAEGLWWKWKIEPMTVDCVLVYAQPGSGRRSSVHTDYTFAVWNRAPESKAQADAVVAAIVRKEPPKEGDLQLVPFAKAYSGLTDEEFREVDALIRRNTVEKFGPVRSVKPMLVFELGFEGINRSTRHRSGIAVRFPRMLRIRHDKPLHEANTLQDLEALLGMGPGATID
jgi:DNA ligase-1